jgi:hypothetical protein
MRFLAGANPLVQEETSKKQPVALREGFDLNAATQYR